MIEAFIRYKGGTIEKCKLLNTILTHDKPYLVLDPYLRKTKYLKTKKLIKYLKKKKIEICQIDSRSLYTAVLMQYLYWEEPDQFDTIVVQTIMVILM